MADARPFARLLPFWLFVALFKIGAVLHYSLMAPLGERVLPLWLVGALIGGSSLLQLLLDVPAGILLDRKGYVRLLRLAACVFLLAAAALFFELTPTSYIATLFLGAGGWLFFGPGVNAYVLGQAPRAEAGRYIALRDIVECTGGALGIWLMAFVVLMPPSFMALTVALFLLCAILAISAAKKDRVSVLAETVHPMQHHYVRRQKLRDVFRALRTLNPASTLLLLHGLAASTFYGFVWFVVPLQVAHEANAALSFGLGVFDFGVLFVGALIGRLADKGDKRFLALIGLLLFGIAGTAAGFTFTPWFIVLAFLATSGDEMAGISLWAWMDSLDRNHRHDALVTGAINFFDDLGWTLGPLFAGILYGTLGPSWTIAAGGSLILVAWITSALLVRSPHRLVVSGHIPRRHRTKH